MRSLLKPPLVVGNWKMHGTQSEALTLARRIRKGLKATTSVEVVLTPPFTALAAVKKVISGSVFRLAAQNVHWEQEGAFTGDISPKMLRELGCTYVIIGHSERRRLFKESDLVIAKKMIASLGIGIRPILCVGETLEERKKGSTTRVITRQLRIALKGIAKSGIKKIEIAYEPIWAIGTGQNATPDQINHTHRRIREVVKELFGKEQAEGCRILYGGSVKPDNAGELAKTPEVNGLLVGGASLKSQDFLSIIHQFAPSRR